MNHADGVALRGAVMDHTHIDHTHDGHRRADGEHAASHGRHASSLGQAGRGSVELLTGDCMESLAGIDDESVHPVLTDPPYFLDRLDDGWDSEATAATRRSGSRASAEAAQQHGIVDGDGQRGASRGEPDELSGDDDRRGGLHLDNEGIRAQRGDRNPDATQRAQFD